MPATHVVGIAEIVVSIGGVRLCRNGLLKTFERTVVLFEPLIAKKQAVETNDGGIGGWTGVEQKLSPSPQLAQAAKALAPFPLPKLGRTAFEFWAFKPRSSRTSTGLASPTLG